MIHEFISKQNFNHPTSSGRDEGSNTDKNHLSFLNATLSYAMKPFNKTLLFTLLIFGMSSASTAAQTHNTNLTSVTQGDLNSNFETPFNDLKPSSLPQDCIEDCDAIDIVANKDAIKEISNDAFIGSDDGFSEDSTPNDDFLEDGFSQQDIIAGSQSDDIDTDDGYVTGATDASDDHDLSQIPLNSISPQTIETFVEVIDVVRRDFLKPINDEALFTHAIIGMLEQLDSHASYLTPENYENLRNFTDGEIGQVGLTVQQDDQSKGWIVERVAANSSANDMGIKSGDRLIKIKDAELLPDLQQQDIDQLLSGIAGSQVQVTIVDQVGRQKDLILQRNISANTQLEVNVYDSIAMIRLPVFQNSSKDQIIDALKQSGEPITGVVIDLRNNPGGVLSTALDIASLFVKNDDLIQVSSRTNNNQTLRSTGTPYLSDLPVVVIQNKFTASAAEVLSSSLKSNNRAIIVGERSFGKGTVQEVVPLKSGGGLKLTVAEYRSSQGEVIDGVGIEPDIYYAHDGSNWQSKAVSILLSKDRNVGIKFDDELNGISVVDDY